MKTLIQEHDALIDKARKRDPVRLQARWYCEWHHINPRSLGGGDEPDNLVLLTYREHRMIHKWLIDIVPKGEPRLKMLSALGMFYDKNGNIFSEQERKEHRDASSEAQRYGRWGVGNRTSRGKKRPMISEGLKKNHPARKPEFKGLTELGTIWGDKNETDCLINIISNNIQHRIYGKVKGEGGLWGNSGARISERCYWFKETDHITITQFQTRREAQSKKKMLDEKLKPRFKGQVIYDHLNHKRS